MRSLWFAVAPALVFLISSAAFAQSDGGAPKQTNEDLVRMGAKLLDNEDLVHQGQGLLDKHTTWSGRDGGAPRAAGSTQAGVAVGSDADGGEASEAQRAADAARDGGDATSTDGGSPGDLDGGATSGDPTAGGDGKVFDGGTTSGNGHGADDRDGGPSAKTSPAANAIPPPPLVSPSSLGPARDQRIRDGKELPMAGADDSPLRKLGVPPAAVPAVATVATIGAMAIWPFLLKTLTALFKSVLGGVLKQRAKKEVKIDANEWAVEMLGFRLRPRELASLLAAAVTYGLAVSYAFLGFRLNRPFLFRQEGLVIAIYFARSLVRFSYERFFRLTTQYKLWIGGALLCLGSAYLGTTLSTVGFEVEGSSKTEDPTRIVKMKSLLIALALIMAVGFCIANLHSPAKVLQSGRVMMSGMALAEILPIQPMPGRKIFAWRKDVWVLLFVLVVPTFFLVNFVL